MSNLIRYDAAVKALAECRAVDEVKDWADKAAAMQAYGRIAKDKTLEVDAAEIRIRAERRLGELLAQQKSGDGLAKPGPKPANNSVVADDRITAPTLAEAGISKDLSARAQKLAAVPAAEFEAEVGEWRERVNQEGARVSAKLEKRGEEIQRAAAPVPSPESEDDARLSLSEIVEELEAENKQLRVQLDAATANDLAAEAVKWRRLYDNAVRQQSEAMDAAAREQKQAHRLGRQVRECCEILGLDDPRHLVSAVRKLAPSQKAAA